MAVLAARQHGMVDARQLLAFMSQDQVDYRVRTGRLHRKWPGVYAVGHPTVSRLGQWIGGVLACGGPGNAALSHLSAAALLGLWPDEWPPVEVSLLRRTGRRSRPGLGIHRPRTLTEADLIARHGIPVTGHMRTLEDIAARVPTWALYRAMEAARKQGQLDLLRAARTPALRAVLSLHHPKSNLTRSDAEAMFVSFCAQHGLPIPALNQLIAGYEADAVFEKHRVIVEIDSAEWHDNPGAYRKDRRRGVAHRAAGYVVVRVDVEQMIAEPHAVLAAVRSALRRA